MADEIGLQRLGLLDQGNSAQAGLQGLTVQGDADGQRAHGCQPIEIDRRQLPQAIELLEASGCDPWALVATTDAVLAAYAETRVPPELAETLREAQGAAMSGLQRVAEASRSLDASLPQMVESARAKVDFQFARLHEGLVGKVRTGLDRAHPGWRRLRYMLLPGDKLQERRLASLEPIARRGHGVVTDLVALATEHALRTSAGQHEHYLLEA